MSDALSEMSQRLTALRPAEGRVAASILAEPGIVARSTITELAKSCGVSSATVTRLFKGLGYIGYGEFRVAVVEAKSRADVAHEVFRIDDSEIGPQDSIQDVVSKIAFYEARAIEETARNIDLAALDTVAEACGSANRIDVFGAASSGLAARDVQIKLARIDVPVFRWSDTHLALSSAALATPQSVLIGISHSGVTPETVELLSVAGARGALTVAITNASQSRLARAATHVLGTSSPEQTFRMGAMSSRLSQMAVIDFLVVRIVQRRLIDAGDLLRRTYSAVEDHRLRHEQD